MSDTRKILDASIRHQIHIERLKTHEAKDLVAAIERSTRIIVSLIRALDVDDLSELKKSELNKLLREAKEAQAKVIDDALRRYEKKSIEIAEYEADFQKRLIDEYLGAGTSSAIAAKAAYDAALRNPIKATGQLLNDFVSDWRDKELKAVEAAIRNGYAEGKSVRDMVTAIRGTKSAGYRDGIMQIAKRHAEAVVRTSIQHIVSRSRQAVWHTMPNIVDRYIWISTLDSRTTDICQGLSGQIFEVGKGPQPPAHINCRSVTTPLIKGDPQPDMPTYYEWLEKQPKSIQEDVLGKTRAKLFRDGGMSAEEFRKFNIGRNLEALPLEQLRRKEPDVFEGLGL